MENKKEMEKHVDQNDMIKKVTEVLMKNQQKINNTIKRKSNKITLYVDDETAQLLVSQTDKSKSQIFKDGLKQHLKDINNECDKLPSDDDVNEMFSHLPSVFEIEELNKSLDKLPSDDDISEMFSHLPSVFEIEELNKSLDLTIEKMEKIKSLKEGK